VSGSPAVPATPAGMLKLAEVLRATNDNAISTGEIADKRNTTASGSVPFRTIGAGDLSADPGFVTGEGRFTSTRGPEYWNGTRWSRVGLEIYGSIAAIPAELAVENSLVYHAGLKRVIRYTSGAWDIPYDVTPGGDVEIAADLAIGTPTLVTNMTVVNKALVGLTRQAEQYPNQLSGGEQQRTAIARALVHDPRIVIADEPTGNLDPLISWEILQLLLRINELGVTVLMATHDADVVTALRKRVVALEEGRVIRDEVGGGYHRAG